MKIRNIMAGLMMVCLINGAAGAATVSVKFFGTVGAQRPILEPQTVFSLGDKVVTEFLFDDSQTGFNLNPQNVPDVAGFRYSFSGGSTTNLTTGTSFALDRADPDTTGIVRIDRSSFGNFPATKLFAFSGAFDSGRVQVDVFGFNKDLSVFQSLTLPDLVAGLGDLSAFSPVGYGLFTTQESVLGSCTGFCAIDLSLDGIKVTVPTPVPVPAALPLMAVGLAGLGFVGRRRAA